LRQWPAYLPVSRRTIVQPPRAEDLAEGACSRIIFILLTNKQHYSNFYYYNCLTIDKQAALLFQLFLLHSTPPAKKTEPSNLVLRAQDHKKNPKFKGWQWDLKNPKFKIRSSKERRTKSEITEIVVEKYVFKIPKIQNFRNTRNQ